MSQGIKRILHISCFSSFLLEGSQCMLEDGKTGICKKLTDCPMRIREVQRGIRHSASTGRCGFSDFTEIVCCPIMNFERKVLLRPADIGMSVYYSKKYRMSHTEGNLINSLR